MYKPLRIIIVFFLLLSSPTVYSQHLSITGISGNLPLHDTAYEAVAVYDSINISIINNDSVAFFDTLDVFIRANLRPASYLYQGQSPDSIGPFNTITVLPPGYHFDPQYFDEGDNIVVIWPAARNIPYTTDSLIDSIYFQSINLVPELNQFDITVFPNPSTDYIYLDGIDKIKTGQVRIYDILGKEYYDQPEIGRYVSIRHLPSGIYYLDIEKTDGSRNVITLVISR
jgi:hypothetical protein